MQIIIFSIPIFVVFLVGEIRLAKMGKLPLFRFNDTIENLSCGLLSELFGLLYKGAIGFLYVAVHARLSLFQLDFRTIATWVYAIVLVDLLYYVVHRSSHRVNVLWAGHIVHHQSEEYNFSVALRQSSLHGLFHWIFYLAAAVLGIPFGVFVAAYAWNLLYQFWIHTQFIKSMGPFESVFNSPSHHRVHHGRDEYCLDKNFAGILILWDRLFGTFQREQATPHFGITSRYRRFNPVFANFQHFNEIWRRAGRMERLRDKLYIWFAPPEWIAPSEKHLSAEEYEQLARAPKYDPGLPDSERRLLRLYFVALVLVAFFILKFSTALPFVAKLTAVLGIGAFLVALGQILERGHA